jgi:cell division protein FtsQ
VNESVLSLPRRRVPPVVLQLVPPGRSIAVALALVLGGVGMWGLARETSMFSVQTVEVRGASPAVAAQVRAALGSFRGKSLLSLDGAAVLRRIVELPTVLSASYDRDFPHTLRVRVVPEAPVAVLRQGAASWLVSARGRVVAPVDRTRFRSLARIWIPPAVDVETGAVLDGASGGTAARSVAQFLWGGFGHRIAWAVLQGPALRVGLRTGLELRLGSPADLRLKIAIAREILPTLKRPSMGGPRYLDLTVPDRPVAGT